MCASGEGKWLLVQNSGKREHTHGDNDRGYRRQGRSQIRNHSPDYHRRRYGPERMNAYRHPQMRTRMRQP